MSISRQVVRSSPAFRFSGPFGRAENSSPVCKLSIAWRGIQPGLNPGPAFANRARIFSPAKRARKSEKIQGTFDRFNGLSSNILLTFSCYFDNPQMPWGGAFDQKLSA